MPAWEWKPRAGLRAPSSRRRREGRGTLSVACCRRCAERGVLTSLDGGILVDGGPGSREVFAFGSTTVPRSSAFDGGLESREVVASLDDGGRGTGEAPTRDGERGSDPHHVSRSPSCRSRGRLRDMGASNEGYLRHGSLSRPPSPIAVSPVPRPWLPSPRRRLLSSLVPPSPSASEASLVSRPEGQGTHNRFILLGL